MMSAKSFGVESYLLSPAEIKEMVPYINEKILVGGFYVPMIGIAHSPTASTIMRDRAVEMGALSVHDETEVLGLTVEQGQIKGVTTDKGYIEAEYVVISCGIWAPRIARMAGAFIPNYPAVHQMISVGPIPFFKGAQKHIEYPMRARYGQLDVQPSNWGTPARRFVCTPRHAYFLPMKSPR
jgi:glycine/D-amino acid oxidase-like deaminating enzyme